MKFPTNSTATTDVCLGSSLYHLVVWTVSVRWTECKRRTHLRIEGCGVLVDHSELAGVGHDQREAQQDDQDVDGDQSLLTAGLGQYSEDDKCEQDVEKS